ncbi:MAG: patatin-like phospholipase family protein [Bacteroidota bacterium]
MVDRDKSASRDAGLVLALSGGGAPGIAHIGVLQVLEENAIPVRAVVGTSIGAEIGAFFASGMPVDELAVLATAFDWKQTLQLFMPDLPTGGVVSGRKIMDFLNARLGAHRIEELAFGYAAVAADLETGEQVVLDRDGLVDAVRASISIPGLITPHRVGNRLLVDGGVLNPVPFDVARQRFGGPVLAVAVHAAARQVARRKLPPRSRQWPQHVRQLLRQPWMMRAQGLEAWLEVQLEKYQKRSSAKSPWTARRVLDQVLLLTQAEMVRLRAATHPPDLMLLPAVGRIGRMEFYRGREAIAAGRAVARERLAEIKSLAAMARDR